MRYIAATLAFIVGIIVDWTWSTHFTVLGLAPQVLLVLTVAVASRNGAVAAQCFGFAWGLYLDVVSAHIFGANALALTLVGYFVGSLRRQMDVTSAGPQLVLVVLLTPAYFLFYGLTGLLFEREFLWVGWSIFLAAPFYNCLFAPLGFEFMRRFVDL